MRWYVCTDFAGHYLNGVAVVQAHSEAQARELLHAALLHSGLPGLAPEDRVTRLDADTQPRAFILWDGDY